MIFGDVLLPACVPMASPYHRVVICPRGGCYALSCFGVVGGCGDHHQDQK